jgi:hypothetical protein
MGYALLLKIDGANPTFYYTSGYWTTRGSSYNTGAFASGLDNLEYQSPLYSVYPFTQLLLGMRYPASNTSISWLPFNYAASSLVSVLQGNTAYVTAFPPTKAQFEAWMSWRGSTQPFCYLVGFNLSPIPNDSLHAHIRIGMMTNEQADCGSPVSFIGFGGQYGSFNLGAGNQCNFSCDNGDITLVGFGYILAR